MSEVTAAALDGYEFTNIVGWSYSGKFYGGLGLVGGLYTIGLSTDIASIKPYNFTNTSTAEKYAFTFGAVIDGYSYSSYSVSFTVGASKELASASVIIKAYDSYTANTDGTVTPGSVTQTQDFEITQTAGERVKDETIDLGKFYFTTWTAVFKDGDTAASDLASLDRGTNYGLSLTSAADPDASIKIDTPTVTLVEGDETGINISTNSWSHSTSIAASKDGTYKIKIATLNYSQEYSLTFKTPAVKSITVYRCFFRTSANGNYYDINDIGGTETVYLDDALLLDTTFLPAAAPQDYVYTITDKAGTTVTTVSAAAVTLPANTGIEFNAVKFTSSVAQDVLITVSSKSDSTIKQVVSASFIARPDMATYLNANAYIYKDYNTSVLQKVLTFSNMTTTSGVISGTVTLASQVSTASEVATFTSAYDATTMVTTLTCTKTSGDLDDMATITIDRYFNLSVIDANTNSYDYLLKTPANMAIGTYAFTATTGVYNIVLHNSGSAQGSFVPSDNVSSYLGTEWNWSIDPTLTADKVYAISFSKSKYTNDKSVFVDLGKGATLSEDYSTLKVYLVVDGVPTLTSFSFSTLEA